MTLQQFLQLFQAWFCLSSHCDRDDSLKKTTVSAAGGGMFTRGIKCGDVATISAAGGQTHCAACGTNA